MSRRLTRLSYKEYKAIKHALEFRLKREDISQKDYQLEKSLLLKLIDEFEGWVSGYGCGCPRTKLREMYHSGYGYIKKEIERSEGR